MADRGLVLLSHGGEEQAVHVADTQELGNPLRLRRALDKGVKVIVAHCAGYGHSQDLDAVNKAPTRANTLFLRMMDEPQYAGRLWGGLSATMLVNRVDTTLRAMLDRPDLHPRLIHGSDYPIPAVDVLINTWQLWGNNMLRWEDRRPLAKLFNDNPLLGEFVLKRVLVNLDGQATGFPPSVFMAPPGLFSGLS
jgi:mannonate dehydratase